MLVNFELVMVEIITNCWSDKSIKYVRNSLEKERQNFREQKRGSIQLSNKLYLL